MSISRRISFAILATLVFPLLAGLWMVAEQLTGNFHEVIPHEFYRSGQPTPHDISEFHRLYGIRSVINLRDDISPALLAQEKSAADKAGMEFYHFPFSSRRHLPIDEMHKLAQMMKDAPKPLLVHCNHGANRTGLAAAVYVAESTRRNTLSPEWQLSPYYGHLPIPLIGRYAMNESWNVYKAAQKF